MVWFLLAALTASCESLKDIFSKGSLKNGDEFVVSWSLMFFSLPFLVPLLLFIQIPTLSSGFWIALFSGGSLNILATILYLKAIKSSDLSLTVPLVTFTPLFLLVTSPLMVKETPGFADFMGILLIILGSYLLNLKKSYGGYLAPFRALLRERGPKLMLGVAFIWSISSNFDKLGVQNSSPTFWAISMYSFLTCGLLPIMLYKSKQGIFKIFQNFKTLVPLGLFNALGILFQMQAISLTLVAHVISVKRTSALMSVVLGHVIFKESGLRERLLGATIMVSGVLFITLF